MWVRYTVVGTPIGEFRGLAPTDKKFAEIGVLIYRIVNGKVVEKDSLHDMLETLKQLGAMESTEKGKKLFPKEV